MARKIKISRVQMETEMAVKLELMGFLEVGLGWRGDAHAHSFWELVFTEGGEGELIYDGESFPVKGEEVFLFEPHVDHRFLPKTDEESRHFYLGFSVDGGFPPWKRNATPPIVDETIATPVIDDLRSIASQMRLRTRQNELQRCSADALGALMKLLAGFLPGAGTAAQKNNRIDILVDKVKRILAENLRESVSVRRLAGSFYLSPHYFGELFKRRAGMSVKEYHNLLRLKKAEDMLRDPEKRVTEIADELGYGSIHYFSRKFKKRHGVSPIEFREKLGF